MDTRLKQVLFGMLWGVLALSAAIFVAIVVSPLLYWISIDLFQLTKLTGLSKPILMQNYDVIIDYLLNPLRAELTMPHFQSSASGSQHFAEVKHLVALNTHVLRISAVVILLTWKKKLPYFLAAPVFRVLWSLPLVLGIVVAIAFEPLFIFFHQVFFRNDLWLFNPATDPIITVLPQAFFMMMFIVVGLLYAIILLILQRYIKRN